MTPKDKRDIASYWNTYTACYSMADGGAAVMMPVNGDVMRDIDEAGVTDFKLHLRPIMSLTDEEVYELAEIALNETKPNRAVDIVSRPGGYYGEHPISYGLLMTSNGSRTYHHDYWLSDAGLFGSGDGDDGSEIYTLAEAAVFAYLQSIGVYVPGMISLEYVQLTDSPQKTGAE